MEGFGASPKKKVAGWGKEGEKAPRKSPGGESDAPRRVRRIPMGGERRLANYKLPDALLAELAKVAKKQGTTQTRIVEDLLVDYLGAVCEECGR